MRSNELASREFPANDRGLEAAAVDTEKKLISDARIGNSEAFRILYRRYRQRIIWATRAFFAPGYDRDDLHQEATIGFFKAIRDYNSDRGTFIAFADLCVRRQIVTFVRKACQNNSMPLNRSISLDAPIYNDSDEPLGARLISHEAPCSTMPNNMEFWTTLWSTCSPLERGVLSMYSKGFTFQDMANELGSHLKAIDNAVWRVKLKARKLAESVPIEG